MKKLLLSVFVLIILVVSLVYILKERSNSLNLKQVDENQQESSLGFNNEILSGEWVSEDDEKFTRKFNNDYTYTDSYEGEVTSNGIWFDFDKNNAPNNFPYDMEDDKTYIIMNDTSTTLAFMISNVSRDKLEMLYLDGGLLRFNKKQ